MIKIFNNLFVTFFYIGTVRYAPGTVASLITTIFLFSSFYILKLSNQLILVIFLIFLVYSFIAVSIYIKHSENKDPKEVVIDEVLGQSIPIITFEFSHQTGRNIEDAISFYFLFFIFFRLYDIFKPFPANYIDKNFKNSFGVIFDDLIAGLYVVLTFIIFMIIKSKFLT